MRILDGGIDNCDNDLIQVLQVMSGKVSHQHEYHGHETVFISNMPRQEHLGEQKELRQIYKEVI